MQERDLDDPSVDRGGGVVPGDIIAADHVQDDVGSPAAGGREGAGDKVLGAVVDPEVGAEALAGGGFVARSPRSR